MTTLTAVVKRLCHRPKNIRNEWSWQNDKQVTLALWSHLLVKNGREYHDANTGSKGGRGNWKDRRRRAHLDYAREHLRGRVLSVLSTLNPGTTTEAIKSVELGPAWRVTKFNRETGLFHLKRTT